MTMPKKPQMAKALNNLPQDDIIDMAYVEELMNKRERARILKSHVYDIYQQKDGRWATYVPNIAKGRVLLRKKSREQLEDEIVEYYKTALFVSFEQLFYEWADKKIEYGEIQKQTYEKYVNDYNKYIANTDFSKSDISDITEEMLEDFIKITVKNHSLTRKAYSGFRTILRGTLKYAKKHKYTNISVTNFFGDLELSRNIFTRKPKYDDTQVFTDKEVGMIREYVIGHPSIVYYGVLFAFYTGLRIGEIAALKKEDWIGNKLIVHRTEIRYRGEDGKYIFDVRDTAKTEAGERVIILNHDAREILNRVKFLNPFGEYIFEIDGRRVKSHNYGNAIVRICERIGIPKRSMHKVRKTFATKLLDAKVSERLITLQMGHTDISCTKNFYYFNNKEEAEAMEQLEKALVY